MLWRARTAGIAWMFAVYQKRLRWSVLKSRKIVLDVVGWWSNLSNWGCLLLGGAVISAVQLDRVSRPPAPLHATLSCH
jgi:hypothetical protein